MKHKKRLQRARSSGEQPSSFSTVMKSAVIALPITLCLSVLLVCGVTALLLLSADPNAYYNAAGLILAYLTALGGGLIATRLNRRRAPLFCGLAMGGLLLLTQLAFALLLPHDAQSSATSFLGLHALMLPVALLGAWLGAKEKNRQHRSRRAR